MTTSRTTYDDSALGGKAIKRDAPELLGQVRFLEPGPEAYVFTFGWREANDA